VDGSDIYKSTSFYELNMLDMKILFFSLLSLTSSLVYSQTYQQMLDHESEWHLTSCFSGCVNDVYYTDGDTVFNENIYKVLNGYHYISRTFWLREDIVNKKVFISTLNGSKRNEDLLYDFSLEPGDSIQINNPLSPFPESPGFFTLDSIISKQLLNGSYYRFFYLSPNSSSSSTENPVWIEGIGSLSLINAPGGAPDVNETGKVSCYFKEGALIYSQLDSVQSCLPIYLNTIEEEPTGDVVKVYPTSCNDILYITSNYDEINNIEIYDMTGALKLQFNKPNKSFNKLNVSGLTSGLFMVRVNLSSGIRTFKISKL